MRRNLCGLAAVVWMVQPYLSHAQQLNSNQADASVHYVREKQNPDGGYRPTATETESDLGAMTPSLRALRYLHAESGTKSHDSAVEFVLKCYNPATGGLGTKPGREPDVRSTATGLMSMAELKMPLTEYGPKIQHYFAENAKSLADIYIAAAALDAAGLKASKSAEWIAAYEAARNADGSYGGDAAQHAGALITMMRLGSTIKDRGAAAAPLRAAQNEDGGFSAKKGDGSDLASTYRIMRGLFMLRQRPHMDQLCAFIDKCRNEDGGYGAKPGEPSTVSATYYAVIVMYWREEFGK